MSGVTNDLNALSQCHRKINSCKFATTDVSVCVYVGVGVPLWVK